MWNRLHKDVHNIVGKYIHMYHTRDMIEEYNKEIKCYWCNLMGCFYADDEYIDFRINYRRLHEYPDQYLDVRIFRTGESIDEVHLPNCYVYTGVWLLVRYELITHNRQIEKTRAPKKK